MKELGTLSPTDIHRLEQLAKMNKSMDEIRRDLERVSELNSEEMNRIFREVSEEQYKSFAKFYLAKGLVQDEIQKQTALKKQLNAIGKITEEAFANLSNTTVMSELYQECIDKGILAAQQGLTDYKSAVRDIIRETAIQGNKVHYESGHRRRRDTAARMNVLDGMRDINMEIARQTGEEFGADGVELSAHMCCAPDHLDYQGKQFSLEEFDRLQETLERRIGVWNCHHNTFPIILGISKPTYSNSDLQKMRDYSTEKITIGKYTKTRYQWTLVQRKLETKVREQKDIANIAKASGNDILRREAQAKINKYTGIYENVSKAAGIPTKKERMAVSGFRPVKAKTSKNSIDKSAERGIIRVGSEVMYRKSRNGKIEPMPKKQLHKIVKSFKRNGGIIQFNKQTDAYLESQQAEAITYNASTILIRTDAGRASIFEELIHATQYRNGENDGSFVSRLKCEIAAQKKLLKNSRAYKLTEKEIEQTKFALSEYEKELNAYNKMGGV